MVNTADKYGGSAFLSGNEAVARGALEADVRVAASYPGTPATEILTTLTLLAKNRGVYTEWSINEKVAVEVAAGAAMCGVRALASMKNVGVNVASDALMTLSYTGVVGGLVVAVSDDPSMHSSQNEQDTRFFAVNASLPLLDVGNAQEAKDMAIAAFELSETLQLPVILRLTTRVSHGKETVKLGRVKGLKRKAAFDKDTPRWTMTPANAQRRQEVLYQRLTAAKGLAEKSPLNIIEDNQSSVGIVGSGVGYYYARSILDRKRFSWLKLGFVHPFPDKLVADFALKVKKVVVVEELWPYLEGNINRLGINAVGKRALGLKEVGEYNPEKIREAFASIGLTSKPIGAQPLNLPSRPPALCPGCPHRAFYYALNAVKKDKIATGDIGCYGLGCLPPLNSIQTALCMGAGISEAAGMRHAGVEDTVFAVIGDSTFFHAGMPALLNLSYNYARVCVVIMSNQTVAMTGNQPTPETGKTAMGKAPKAIRIEGIVKALGIDRVETVDPYQVDETQKAIKAVMSYDGPSVIISKRTCALLADKGKPRTVSEQCISCGKCVTAFGCPAISIESGKAAIDSSLCRGCGVCQQICPYNAIVSEQ